MLNIRRPLAWSGLAVALAAPAAAQHTRISVSTAGVEANGSSRSPTVSATGRFVGFVSEASNLVAGDTNGVADVFVRDRDTDADGVFDEADAVSTRRLSVGPQGVQADAPVTEAIMAGRFVAFRSAATTLVPGTSPGVHRIYVADLETGVVELASASTGGTPADLDSDGFDIGATAEGYVVAFQSASRVLAPGDVGSGGAIFSRTWPERVTRRLSPALPPAPPDQQQQRVGVPSVSPDGAFVGYAIIQQFSLSTFGGRVYRSRPDGSALQDLGRGARIVLSASPGAVGVVPIGSFLSQAWVRRTVAGRDADAVLTGFCQPVPSVDGRHWLCFRLDDAFLHDFLSGERTPLPFGGIGDWSLDGRTVVTTIDSPLAPGATQPITEIYAIDLPRLLDADQDGLDDRWERLSGLDPADATGANGPAGDPDGDGLTNAQEFATTTQPGAVMTLATGTTTRYFAEGVTGAFFDTELDLLNPSNTTAAAVHVRYRTSGGDTVVQPLRIEPHRRRTLVPAGEPALGHVDVSMEIESNIPVVADRKVAWDASGYGAHFETSQSAAATTWYLTEGTTVLGFELFYLLLNPNAEPAQATIRYLRPSGPPLVRTYTLAPTSRLTVHVNAVDGQLAASDVSGEVTSDRPIVVERAMYASRGGRTFALGTASAGVSAASTSWFLAEGATGAFFDTYVLMANPSVTDAAVTARFLTADGSVVTRSYTIAAGSRFSIFVDAIEGLEATAVSTEILSTNGVPVTVERAMYWPGGFFDYYEGHTAVGVTAAATRWALAAGEAGGSRDAQSYVLIANPGPVPGLARVTLLGEGDVPVAPTVVTLPAGSRVTVNTSSVLLGRYGALVESIGDAPVPIVVEGAFYWNAGGQVWAAGGALVATPLP